MVLVSVVCWVVALVGGALVVVLAAGADIYRCADGWTNRGQAQWFSVIAALVLTGPAPSRAVWLMAGSEGSARLRWATVAIGVAVPVVTIALALGFLPNAPATGFCFD
jgi:hypothetical protein